MTSRIAQAFAKAKAENRAAFVAYLTGGDPSLEATESFVKSLARGGVDLIELGVPFSDPVADGPTIQKAMSRALRGGTDLKKILELTLRLRRQGVETPIIVFTYFNPLLSFGLKEFAHQASVAGVNGVLCLDLPPEEAEDYRQWLGSVGLDTVFLAATTSDEARLALIDKSSTGFVYYVSRAGVTGARASLPETLAADCERLRKHIRKNPIAVGFGISTPEHAREVGRHADGVVVGSAFIKLIEDAPNAFEASQRMETFAASISEALRGKKP